MASFRPLAFILISACAVEAEPALSPDDGFDDTVDDGKADASNASVGTVHRFADRKLYPEGGAFDPSTGAFFVGSLGHGNITRVSPEGTETVFHGGTGETARFTLGMQVDAARNRLWVCTTKDSLGSIWIFDLASGARTADIDLTVANPEAACNDVLLHGDGALVSDRENHHIYRVDASGAVSVWADHALLGGAVISLNSMDFTPDGKYLLTATYLEPALIRVTVANPREVKKVQLSGDMFMDGFNLLNGPDDLVVHGNDLIVAFGSSIKRITPSDASWSKAKVRSTRTIGGVTALVEDGDRLYAINGQSVRFALKVPPAQFQIFEVDTRALR